MSGDVTKAFVLAWPSFRFGQLRLSLLLLVFALAASRSASNPSRAIVARTCSEPGVMSSCTLERSPLADAWRAIDAARVMSSYDEFVHEPTSADEISVGTPLAFAHGPTSEIACARSG